MTPVPAPDFKCLFETAPGLYLVLLPDFTIAAVSDSYLRATMTERDAVIGRGLFDVFPDNPDDDKADGVLNLRASLNYVVQQGQPNEMAVQKYDIRRPDGMFETRYWSPLNTPVFNAEKQLVYIIHNVADITTRIKAEENLKKSEKTYQLLVNSVKDYAIFMVDTHGCVVSWNSGAESINGYTAKEIIGRPVTIFYTAEEIQKGIPQNSLQSALQYGHFETEGWRVKKDGSSFYANTVFTSLLDEEGMHYGFAELTRNITEKRKAEERIRFLAGIADNIQDVIISSDNDYHITRWNKAAERLLEWSSEEVIGKTTVEVLRTINPHYTRPQIIAIIAEKGIWRGEIICHTKSGKPVDIMVAASKIKDEDGRETGNLILIQDITEKKKAEERIRFLAGIADNIQDIVISSGNNYNITRWNEAAEKLLEWKSEEVIGKTTVDILKTVYLYESRAQILAVIAEKGIWRGELIYHTKSGRPVNVMATASKLKDAEGNETGNLIVVRDITDQIKAQAQLKEFEHFFNNSNDLSCIANKEGYFEIVNPSFKKLLDYDQNELSEKPFIDFVHPDDIAVTLQQYDKLKSGALVLHFINRYRKKDGDYLWLDWNATPNPSTGKLYCIARDITIPKELEDKLKKTNEELEQRVEERTEEIQRSEKKYRYLFENNPLPMWVIEANTFKFLDVNEMAIRHYGYSREEFLSMTAVDIRPDSDKQAFLETDHSFNVNPVYINRGIWNHQKKDGTIIQVEINAHQIIFERTRAKLILANDVTAKMKAERQLASSEKRFRALVENNYDIISLIDESFKIIYQSPSLHRVMGWSPKEIKQLEGINNFHPHDKAYALQIIQQATDNPGIPIRASFRRRHKNGHYVWLEGVVTNLLHDKNIHAFVTNFRDVTEQKTAEKKLKASEERFRTIIDQYPSPVVRYAPDGTFITANPAWEIMWDDKLENVEGYNIRNDPQMAASGLLKNIEQAFAGKVTTTEVFQYDPSVIGKTGRKRWIQLLLYPLKDTGGNILEVILITLDMTDNTEAEEKLVQSEIRFRSLIENSTEGISLSDEFSNVIYRSPSGIKVTGLLPNENILTRIHPEDAESIKSKLAEVLQQPGVPVSFQGRFFHAASYYYWMEGTITNMLHIKGVNAIVSNYRDITERKELEELLHKANSLAKIGGWEVDLIKGTVYWSDITREIHETGSDYMPDLQTGIDFYKEGKGRNLIIEKVQEAVEWGKPWDEELQIVTAKNNERWIRTIGETEFVNGKCVRIYGSFQDIDQRKKAEEKLIESEKLYRSLFTNMLNGFSYCRAEFEGDILLDYTYLAVNSEYEVLTGLKNITGKKVSEVIPGLLKSDPTYVDIICGVALHGQAAKFETYVEPLNRWFSVSLYSPEKGYFVSLVDNISERKAAEQKIQKINIELEERVTRRTEQLKKTNEELEAFSYSVSHDLRAPLRAIIGFTTILEEDYSSKLDQEAKRITTVIKNNTLKMGHLIDDLLTFSRMGRQDIIDTKIDTNGLVREITGVEHASDSSNNIDWLIHPLPCIRGDLNTIRQVWVNLISNAVKYSAKAARPKIEIGSYMLDGQSVFFVKDNGVGFDEQYKAKLFKVFQRLHSADEFEGTGVGLAIVEKVISKHGGHVWAEGKINEGACFFFSLLDECKESY